MNKDKSDFDPFQITRPDRVLLKHYMIQALFGGPLFPILALPLYFKYETLKYRFDNDGISMSWGILFRHEVYLTYRRIQDIHLTRGIIQRWLGLSTISVQTASGSSTPEMSIEGVLQAELLRDFLYAKMRGSHQADDAQTVPSGSSAVGAVQQNARSATDLAGSGATGDDEVLLLLREIRDGLRAMAGNRGARQ